MDELDLFCGFRVQVAPPSDDARRLASARLVRAIGGQRRGPKVLRLVAVGLAALVAATATALFVSTPWSSSPGFLERAQAALTPPAGTILHQKSEATSTWTELGCTVTRGTEIWIDETPPYRFRIVQDQFPADPENYDPRSLACSTWPASELGGTPGAQMLRFVPPNTLSTSGRFEVPVDPVAELRQAIGEGRARDEGETTLDGRTVRRIRIEPEVDCRVPGCPRDPVYTYVDAETFYPVEIHGFGFIGPLGSAPMWSRVVMRYSAFEYLPRTDANLALTDIRAQHPDATGP
jgi:hypothetical protein